MRTNRKPRLVVDNNTPILKVKKYNKNSEAYGNAILSSIRHNNLLNQVDYFTRETLMVHLQYTATFGRVAIITRYGKIREGVNYLVEKGSLTRPNNSTKYLCFPKNTKRASKALHNPIPLYLRYYDQILNVIKETNNKTITVMEIVNAWNTTTHTEDNKRVLVRHTLHIMAKKGLLKEHSDYSYTINKKLYEEEYT